MKITGGGDLEVVASFQEVFGAIGLPLWSRSPASLSCCQPWRLTCVGCIRGSPIWVNQSRALAGDGDRVWGVEGGGRRRRKGLLFLAPSPGMAVGWLISRSQFLLLQMTLLPGSKTCPVPSFF